LRTPPDLNEHVIAPLKWARDLAAAPARALSCYGQINLDRLEAARSKRDVATLKAALEIPD
jgi:hypothetical protein